MKLPIVISLLVGAGGHSLRKQEQPAFQNANPALGALSGGGNYYTQAFTSESIGDPRRGGAGCTAWRKTLSCNPSGPRDMEYDKSCTQVVNSGESGFCECGNFAQFAAVDCNHRPFTCETMCLKFAVVTGKPLPPGKQQLLSQSNFGMPNDVQTNMHVGQQSSQVLSKTMYGQQDLKALDAKAKEIEMYMDMAKRSSQAAGEKAKASIRKFMGSMHHAQAQDKAAAAKALAEYSSLIKEHPFKGMADGGKQLENIGKELQERVAQITGAAR